MKIHPLSDWLQLKIKGVKFLINFFFELFHSKQGDNATKTRRYWSEREKKTLEEEI